jgi:hypothetical protein
LRPFTHKINTFFSIVLEIKFFCEERVNPKVVHTDSDIEQKFDIGRVYVIQGGKILEKRELSMLSNEYMDFLLDKFNLNQYINKQYDKSNNKMNFTLNFIPF